MRRSRYALRTLISVAVVSLASSALADEFAADALHADAIRLRTEGRYVEATQKARMAVSEAEASGLHQTKAWAYAVYQHGLGDLCILIDHFDCARSALTKALEIRKVADADALPDTMNAIGRLHQRMGQFSEAEALITEVAKVYEQKFGRTAHGVGRAKLADVQTNLGILYREMGKLDLAEAWLTKALKLREQVPGAAREGYVANGKFQLAALYRDRASTRTAEPLAREAVEIWSRLGNRQSLASGQLLHADILRAEGRLREAERYATLALEIRKKEFGPDSLNAASAFRVMGAILESRERLVEAEEAYRQALKIRAAQLPSGHPALAASQANLGALLKSTGKLAEAEQLLQSALKTREQKLGLNHPDTIRTLDTLGDLMRRAGRVDEARELFEKADKHRRSSVYEIRILFATNRAPEASVDGALRFGTAEGNDQALTMGIADVLVPNVRGGRTDALAQAEVVALRASERPQEEEATDPGNMSIRGVWMRPANEMVDLGRARVQQSQKYGGKALVFIHGFNTSFDNALARAAQIAYDLQFDGPVYLFSWPSKGGTTTWDHIKNIFNYTPDRTSAANARVPFSLFLKQVLLASRPSKTVVIAHSMGNRLLLETLRDSVRTPQDGIAAVVGDLIFAAPDIPRSEFKTFMDELRPVGGIKTMYAARTDRALKASHKFWKEAPAGLIEQSPRWQFWRTATLGEPLVVAGVETIDVSAASRSGPLDFLSLNHDLYASNSSLIEDMRGLFESSTHPPHIRNKDRFVMNRGGDGHYWVLKLPSHE